MPRKVDWVSSGCALAGHAGIAEEVASGHEVMRWHSLPKPCRLSNGPSHSLAAVVKWVPRQHVPHMQVGVQEACRRARREEEPSMTNRQLTSSSTPAATRNCCLCHIHLPTLTQPPSSPCWKSPRPPSSSSPLSHLCRCRLAASLPAQRGPPWCL